ncbi:TRAP transporter substrate-binding protein [Desulforhopalus singaporensis]|uniref:TRAP-type C4-dicarboxylate transport system, substrate-binding protein n=1 Tax=Desulforhopalus singaporensis TaxID=91360 RepID=A0A1H0ISY6_9BACT|nr:TRAP transporter substrate-binding protein [Desulforhopalus singaporensis]SDO34529.1 TRAP-type C4-dicarboxylate transport system, substrate-binding protein [Desulforhopalus singaporensis]
MKRMVLSGLTVIAIFSLLVVTPVFSQAKSITLKYASFFPPTHIQSQLAESWCKEVEKQTEGRVKVQLYPGGSLLKAKQTYDGVVDGIADVGFTVLAYTRGRFPVTGALDLPFGYPSGRVATSVANDLYNALHPKEFDDTHLLYLHAHGPGFINTREKAITNLEDLKGLRIRSTGMSAEMVKALGATPVAMGMGDAYQSLQKGVVDGSAHPMEANGGWKLGEVTRYTAGCYASAYTTTFIVTMNKDKWESLDKKDQDIITEINKVWLLKHGDAWDSSDLGGLKFALEQGGSIKGIDPEETKRWQAAVSPVIDSYAAELDKKNLNGAKVVEIIRNSLKAHM